MDKTEALAIIMLIEELKRLHNQVRMQRRQIWELQDQVGEIRERLKEID